tara:strand:+ start:686 stop:898 length:213 start_codon:yes stop_codon:yes gene_type:complete
MSWKDVMKNEKDNPYDRTYEIDASSMHLHKYRELKIMAMYRLLERHYSAPELEGELIDMMENIAEQKNIG